MSNADDPNAGANAASQADTLDFDGMSSHELMQHGARLLQLAEDENDGAPAVQVGHWVAAGRFDGLPPEKALECYTGAYKRGEPQGAYFAGALYFAGTVLSQDYAKAFAWFQKAADAGLPEGLFAVGDCHLRGTGTPQNFDAARRYFELAAEAGNADGRYHLGALYVEAIGVPQDIDLGEQLIRQAMAEGCKDAKQYLWEQDLL